MDNQPKKMNREAMLKAMRIKMKKKRKHTAKCISCGTIIEPGGIAETDMCGPCCTGEADTGALY